jgi:hypothetical protein
VRPPVISWDGKQLTIDAENSTLSEVLLGIRAKTGASIDMPGSTAAERVAVHLGPAPIRDVLSSLLYGTDFDYVIQASDTDERGLRSVILTARDKGDDVAASNVSANPHMRLMPGYAAPGKRDFEVSPEPTADAVASPPAEPVAASEPAPSQQPGSSSTGPAAASAQASTNPDSQPTSPTASADAGVLVGDQPLASNRNTGATSSGQLGSSDGSSITEMEANLQRLYQQRQQLQQQRNQAPPPGK